MSLLATLSLILLPPFLTTLVWLTALHHHPTPNPTTSPITNTRILILISHPDDEAMFFSPTLLHLTPASLKNDIRLICLSSGNADGIGHIRRKEIVESCNILGIPKSSSREGEIDSQIQKVLVFDHPSLPDSMKITWSPTLISSEVSKSIAASWGGAGKKGWIPEIIITFDKFGVSGHGNHVSAWKGAREYILHHQSQEKKIKLLTLTTTSLFRKYLSIWDWPFTYFFSSPTQTSKSNSLMFVSTPTSFSKARTAMTKAHKSQMRWFRWGWIWLSRYMVVNDLVQEEVVGLASGVDADADAGKGEKEL